MADKVNNHAQVTINSHGEPETRLKDWREGLKKANKKLRQAVKKIKKTEQEKETLKARLAYAQKIQSVGTLAGGIAHNFNNLLMGIQGNISILLLDIDTDHPHYKYLENIEKLVSNGTKLTSQLLGYAREGRYELKPIDLNHIVKEISETFGDTRKEILIRMDLTDKLCGINGDQGQIEQVILNLCINASDAMEGGGELLLKTDYISLSNKDTRNKPYKIKAGNYARLLVRDTGVGMDRETMKKIFEPFFTTKGTTNGTGLGLASAYGIIKGHGGFIDVESEKGKGTTFSIFLPASPLSMTSEINTSQELLMGKETVLLVDDEELIIDVGGQMLERMGYEVLMARSGKKALELLVKNENRIDIVLLDMVMPDLSGGETYDRMKALNPDIKVILSSGYTIDGRAAEILARGCNGFIQKPFRITELSRKIREILDDKSFPSLSPSHLSGKENPYAEPSRTSPFI
ncbi:MAG: response regulator [Deltaproteobacteria bacterium]|nr:response regulator [Deltaproteobacteria bacterium]